MVKKENLFEYLGRRTREEKERKERIENKYWKLSPIERIDYDNKRKRVERENYLGFLPLTCLLVKIALYFVLGGLFFYYISGKELLFLKLGLNVGTTILYLLGWIIIGDVIIGMIFLSKKNKILRELNKRFKLN